MEQVYKKKRWDRTDGWLLKCSDPILSLVPFIMETRLDSQNLFEDELPVERLDEFVKEHCADIPGLSIMYVIMAALVRLISQRPYINRFVVHNKIYARSQISICVTVKRGLSDKGGEAVVKVEFEPDDALKDIVSKIEKEMEEGKSDNGSNNTDKTARFLDKIPAFIKRFVIRFLMFLDNIGKLPKKLIKASPWHTSIFLTNVGSLGIGSIYHHLYKFGTCSLFAGMGKKYKKREAKDENEAQSGDRSKTLEIKRMIGLKFVTDERICDGHYYALSMRYLRKLLIEPEKLLVPPKKIIYDDQVKSPCIIPPK